MKRIIIVGGGAEVYMLCKADLILQFMKCTQFPEVTVQVGNMTDTENQFPQISGKIVVQDFATPLTYERRCETIQCLCRDYDMVFQGNL